MRIGIGIDTGGTYTDAVLYDLDDHTLLAKGKSRTTKGDLSKGIVAAIDLLPIELARKALIVALSTTLATNACVEGKGARSRLILMGMTDKALRAMDVKTRYGFDYDDAICVACETRFNGEVVSRPDWPQVIAENTEWLLDAQGLGVSAQSSLSNGGILEKECRDTLSAQFDMPIVLGNDVAHSLNMVERGATALLNARLLPLIEDFLDAVKVALRERGIAAQAMVVRSDGTFMNEARASTNPVETIVSGPAASVRGCAELAECDDYLVVDMGGTTTDVSIVMGGEPSRTQGTRIGNWRTQVAGVFVDTFGLGGDSAVKRGETGIYLSERRVEPLCIAAQRWPGIIDQLQELVTAGVRSTREVHEALYLAREPYRTAAYNEIERELIDMLRKGPLVVGVQKRFEPMDLDGNHISARLENEGVVMRCGFTPTDAMHLKGDFNAFDERASLLAAEYLCQCMSQYNHYDEGIFLHVDDLCDDVYDAVERKLYINLVRVLWQNAQAKKYKANFPIDMEVYASRMWDRFTGNEQGIGLGVDFSTKAKLVGVGAPTKLFLPRVAAALGTDCITPEHAEVANAIGAIATKVSAQVAIEIREKHDGSAMIGYSVLSADGNTFFADYASAEAFAKDETVRLAIAEARRRGAEGELDTDVSSKKTTVSSKGIPIFLSALVTATAAER